MEQQFMFVMFLSILILITHDIAAEPSTIRGNESDYRSLLEIKRMLTHDPLGVVNSWNDSIHFCRWRGVSCGTRWQRVTALDLSSSGLGGTLSPHIGNMSFLGELVLRNNTFVGPIPQEIGMLSRLETLALENNSFSGEIPGNLSRCIGLRYIGLDGNSLTGSIPESLGNSLRNLEILFLRSNGFTGELPYSLGNLSSLVALAGTENSFTGELPSSLGQLRNLTYLAFGGNNLTGSIPLSIFNLSSLDHIALPVNRFIGTLPDNLGLTLPNLHFLFLHSNSLSGPLPSSLTNLSDIKIISLSRNRLTGKIPTLGRSPNLQGLAMHYNNIGNGKDHDMDFFSSLINCSAFEELSLSVNNIGGRLPDNIGNFSTKFRSIGLAANKLVGRIPEGIVGLSGMEVISLEYNRLTGEIPGRIAELSELRYLWLKGNRISGEIPPSIGNSTLISGLNLAQNDLEGTIPSSLGKCRLLQMLYLSGNRLSGSIPKEIFGLSSLSIQLDLSDNRLTGPLPLEVGGLVNLGYMNLSWNRLSGKIPSTLGSCIKLEELYIQGNTFRGSIPPSLSSLKGLEKLDISHNNLSGPIPNFLESFTSLISLNLSHNRFEGEVPIKGVFKNSSAVAINGNGNLCGGLPQFNLLPCETASRGNRGLSLAAKIAVSVVCGLLGAALVSLLLILRLSRKRGLGRSRDSQVSSDGPFLKMSYADLLKATDNFSEGNLVGQGSFGRVYRGVLEPEGREIAVKVLKIEHERAKKSFIAECEVLGRLRHRNLLKLLTVYSGSDYNGNELKALVYEFVSNGSLEDWLHPNPRGSRVLDFHQRVKIAMDIAFALDYLHEGNEVPVVHRDLKPSNVLLHEDMTACLGDFGVAKFLEQFSADVESGSMVINGTVGYAAPEYGMGSQVSTYGDIYSYGIIILELFTGKRPTNDMFNNGLDLHNYVKMALPEGILGIVDPMMFQTIQEEVEEKEEKEGIYGNSVECLVDVLQIGIACTLESPTERMDISDVVRELHLVEAKLVK